MSLIRLQTILLAVLLVADGILTYNGVMRFGIGMEANPIAVLLITTMGLLPAMVVSRIIALISVAGLHYVAHGELHRETQTQFVLVFLIMFYVYGSILPWSIILR